MTHRGPTCDDAAEVLVMRQIELCWGCAFEQQAGLIEDAIAEGIIAFDHNDDQGRAVYRSLIWGEPRG